MPPRLVEQLTTFPAGLSAKMRPLFSSICSCPVIFYCRLNISLTFEPVKLRQRNVLMLKILSFLLPLWDLEHFYCLFGTKTRHAVQPVMHRETVARLGPEAAPVRSNLCCCRVAVFCFLSVRCQHPAQCVPTVFTP